MDGEEQKLFFHILLSARYDTGREGHDVILFCDVRLDPWQKQEEDAQLHSGLRRYGARWKEWEPTVRLA